MDEGTKLLLDHLPDTAPGSFLDVGCGWGALGLPVAAAHPGARALLLDRDLRAVTASQDNARRQGLDRVRVVGGLGYRDLDPAERFDWVLCNVPARIGPVGVAHLLGQGTHHLTSGGVLRAVIIHALWPDAQRMAQHQGWPLRLVAKGPRHSVVELSTRVDTAGLPAEPYARDQVSLVGPGGPLQVARPHDINQDTPHLNTAWPLLLEMLPRTGSPATLCVRAGYGAVHAALGAVGCRVVAVDRDLLALSYVEHNTRGQKPGCTVVQSWRAEDAAALGPFSCVVLEHTATGAGRADADEWRALAPLLARDGKVLALGRSKALQGLGLPGTALARRGDYSVWHCGAAALTAWAGSTA